MKRAIIDIPLSKLKEEISSLGLKPYAADQILKWLYEKRVTSFEQMTNLSKDARAILDREFQIDALEVSEVREATDGTKKYALKTHDGLCVECVKIPSDGERTTACLSTQAGCAMNCAFCRTAKDGLKRNLTQGEILFQLMYMLRDGNEFTNIVFMGMGEPLANAENVSNAIDILCEPFAFKIAKKRITVSTAGLLPELEEFSKKHDVKIAISLNAADDETRNKLMPINKRYNIADIMAFCRRYIDRSRFRVTFEYVLIRDVNDSQESAKKLADLLQNMDAKVNIIPFNEFEGSTLKAPTREAVKYWSEYLYSQGIHTNIRASRGQDIYAACGMLALKKKSEE